MLRQRLRVRPERASCRRSGEARGHERERSACALAAGLVAGAAAATGTDDGDAHDRCATAAIRWAGEREARHVPEPGAGDASGRLLGAERHAAGRVQHCRRDRTHCLGAATSASRTAAARAVALCSAADASHERRRVASDDHWRWAPFERTSWCALIMLIKRYLGWSSEKLMWGVNVARVI